MRCVIILTLSRHVPSRAQNIYRCRLEVVSQLPQSDCEHAKSMRARRATAAKMMHFVQPNYTELEPLMQLRETGVKPLKPTTITVTPDCPAAVGQLCFLSV